MIHRPILQADIQAEAFKIYSGIMAAEFFLPLVFIILIALCYKMLSENNALCTKLQKYCSMLLTKENKCAIIQLQGAKSIGEY